MTLGRAGRRTVAAGLACAAMAAGLGSSTAAAEQGAGPTATSSRTPSPSTAPAGATDPSPGAADRAWLAEGTPGSPEALVEDFRHPGRDAILKEHGVKLLRGDGHILWVECGGAGDTGDVLSVYSRGKGRQCFRVDGPTGWLTLEMPQTYLAVADSHKLDVAVTVDGNRQTASLDKHETKPLGEGLDPKARPATLVEITARP